MHQKRREKEEQAAARAQEEAAAAAAAAAAAEVEAAAAAAATAAAKTASLDSLRGLVGPASDAMSRPAAPVAAPSSMYGGLSNVAPPAAISIPPREEPRPARQPEPEPEQEPQHMITGSPPSYPGPVPAPAPAGHYQAPPYQPPPAQSTGYQPPPAHAPGYEARAAVDPAAGAAWAGAAGGNSRPLPAAIGSLASQRQGAGNGGDGQLPHVYRENTSRGEVS